MNKNFFWTSITLFALTLTACASSTGTSASAPSGGPDAVELPAQTKLILGAINLEETEYPITSEQAKELLPMFYVLQDLNDSDTAAQEEIDGLVAQIQETLSTEQTQAIDGMSLSMRDVFAISQGSSGSTSSSDAESATSAGGPPDMGAGGPPDMGGMPGGGMQSTGTTSTSSDTSAAPVMDTSTPSALFDAVIALLQKKIDA